MEKRKRRFHRIENQFRRSWNGKIKTDVLGSYTGCGYDDEYPVQDQDDL